MTLWTRIIRSLYWSYFFFTQYGRFIVSLYTPSQLAQLTSLANAIATDSATETQDEANVAAAQLAITNRDATHAAAVAAELAQYQSDSAVLQSTLTTAQTAVTTDDGITQAAVSALVAYAANPTPDPTVGS